MKSITLKLQFIRRSLSEVGRSRNFKLIALSLLFAITGVEIAQAKGICGKGKEWRNGKCRTKKKKDDNKVSQPAPTPMPSPVVAPNPMPTAPAPMPNSSPNPVSQIIAPKTVVTTCTLTNKTRNRIIVKFEMNNETLSRTEIGSGESLAIPLNANHIDVDPTTRRIKSGWLATIKPNTSYIVLNPNDTYLSIIELAVPSTPPLTEKTITNRSNSTITAEFVILNPMNGLYTISAATSLENGASIAIPVYAATIRLHGPVAPSSTPIDPSRTMSAVRETKVYITSYVINPDLSLTETSTTPPTTNLPTQNNQSDDSDDEDDEE